MERAKPVTNRRSRWMSRMLLIGAWIIVIPAGVQAEGGTADAPAATPAAESTVSAPAQEEKLQAELKAALQQIETLEQRAKTRQRHDNLTWTMMVESGF